MTFDTVADSVQKVDIAQDISAFIQQNQSETPTFEKKQFEDYQSNFVSRQKNAEIRQRLKDQEKDIAFILKKQVSTMQKPQLTEAQLELNR